MAEDFLLKWNDHHTLFFQGAERLCKSEEFTDVTLAADSKFFKAHRLVLSICSPFFEALFRRIGSDKPVIFLKDISAKHLELLLQYMYKGEIKVQEHELVTVLNAAQSLEIRGLTDNSEPKKTDHSNNLRQISSKPSQLVPTERKSAPFHLLNNSAPITNKSHSNIETNLSNIKKEAPVIDVDQDEMVITDTGGHGQFSGATSTTDNNLPLHETGYDEAYEGYEGEEYLSEGQIAASQADKVEEFISAEGIKMWRCKLCQKSANLKSNMLRHMSIHTGVRPYSCRYCSVAFSVSSNRLRHEKSCKFMPQY